MPVRKAVLAIVAALVGGAGLSGCAVYNGEDYGYANGPGPQAVQPAYPGHYDIRPAPILGRAYGFGVGPDLYELGYRRGVVAGERRIIVQRSHVKRRRRHVAR